jgi:hypothetical protein
MAVVAGLAAAALIQASFVVGAAGTHNLIQLGWAEGESLGVQCTCLRASELSVFLHDDPTEQQCTTAPLILANHPAHPVHRPEPRESW